MCELYLVDEDMLKILILRQAQQCLWTPLSLLIRIFVNLNNILKIIPVNLWAVVNCYMEWKISPLPLLKGWIFKPSIVKAKSIITNCKAAISKKLIRKMLKLHVLFLRLNETSLSLIRILREY